MAVAGKMAAANPRHGPTRTTFGLILKLRPAATKMCGICGLFSYAQGDPVDPLLLRRMTASMVHRGPDDEGYLVDDGVGLGFRRLSIIDVAGGHQPLPNEQQTVWVVFNGEIYNFRELRRELQAQGHVFRTRSDSEVIVHAYEEWGDDCLLRLNGMFGFSIWDRTANRVLLARDHFGIKPVYYYDDGRCLRWASEIKALLTDPALSREVDPAALDLFLTFRFVPSPRTMFGGIRKLAPGHCLIADRSGVSVRRYWNPRPTTDATLTVPDYVVLLQELIEKAVKRQMVSDVPIGALLSGGIDSAVVVAIMSQAATGGVRTFSVGFKDGGHLNELTDARATARLFGTEHHEVTLDSQDFVRWIERTAWQLEEPISSTAPLSLHAVCRLAREHVKVVLTGQGADEPFCGYYRYLGERYGSLFRALPPGFRARLVQPLVEALPRSERLKRAAAALGSVDVTQRFADAYAVFPQQLRAQLWRGDRRPILQENHVVQEVVSYWRRGVESLDPLVQMAYVDARLSLPDDYLIYADKMAMATSLEARVPLLDLDLMNAAEAMPASFRVRRLRRKYIYKKVVAKWLPREVIARRKRGFEAPTDRWFRSELTGFVRQSLLGRQAACGAYFDPVVLERILEEHVRGRRDHRRQLFNLLLFEMWHRRFIGTA
jgi:asparagine synthase (glutamine-hydrolysing)